MQKLCTFTGIALQCRTALASPACGRPVEGSFACHCDLLKLMTRIAVEPANLTDVLPAVSPGGVMFPVYSVGTKARNR